MQISRETIWILQ
jgi:hypothetical protein